MKISQKGAHPVLGNLVAGGGILEENPSVIATFNFRDSMKARSSNRFPFLVSVAMALAAMGCAKTQTVVQPQTDAAVCDALRNVVSQSASGFSSLKEGAGVSDYDHTRWDSKPIFQQADCDVISWGNGKNNYACTWASKSQADAGKDFSYGVGVAKSCLGSSWTESAIPGSTGQGTRFSTAGNPSVVDVRVAKELAPSQSWHTSLTVGSPINRDAK